MTPSSEVRPGVSDVVESVNVFEQTRNKGLLLPSDGFHILLPGSRVHNTNTEEHRGEVIIYI